jgi:hypothetical protein
LRIRVEYAPAVDAVVPPWDEGVRRVYSPLADVDFSTCGDQPGWPTPFQCATTYISVTGSAGRGVTNPANHQNLPAYRATVPQLVQSVDSWGIFGIDQEPTGGEVTHGFAFITEDGQSSYFTELVHRPGTDPVVQCGQIMEPFPDYGPQMLTYKTVLSTRACGFFAPRYGLRNRVDIDPTTGLVRFRTRIWDASQPEPTTWFQDASTVRPSLAKSGYLSVQFSQGSAEPVNHTHYCDRVSLGALA